MIQGVCSTIMEVSAMANGLYLTLLLLTALGCALVAGIFFAFSNFVMQALARLPPAHGIAAMQSINVTVLNRWFLLAFVGTAGLSIVVIAAALLRRQWPEAFLPIAGAALYLAGNLFVTRAFNIPLNDALAAADADSVADAAIWQRYLRDWKRWNTVRTITALAASALLMVALVIA